eukprot:scaffold19110_cov89-Skeletonema_marinoi.AAC.3
MGDLIGRILTKIEARKDEVKMTGQNSFRLVRKSKPARDMLFLSLFASHLLSGSSFHILRGECKYKPLHNQQKICYSAHDSYLTSSQYQSNHSFIVYCSCDPLIMMQYEYEPDHVQGNKPPRLQHFDSSNTYITGKIDQGELMADDWQPNNHLCHPKWSSPLSVRFNIEKTTILQYEADDYDEREDFSLSLSVSLVLAK